MTPCCQPRRRLLAAAGAGLVGAPFAGLFAGCADKGHWPEGMAAIHWDRETCVRCSMVISDRRFAAEVRGGPKSTYYKFDDIGCVVFWLANQSWAGDAATKIWVADAGTADLWLDARHANYLAGKTSPMGYNFAASGKLAEGAVDFGEMSRLVLARGK